MNKDIKFYLTNIDKTGQVLHESTENEILKFYNKYRNIYEFDDLMNVNCQNRT